MYTCTTTIYILYPQLVSKHNFTFLGGQDSMGTREASQFQTTNSNAKRSKKEELLDQQMQSFLSQRDDGIPKRIARQ